MEHASRADATPNAVSDYNAGGPGSDRPGTAQSGAGIGLRQIRAKSVPIPVPSIGEPVDRAPVVTEPVETGLADEAELVDSQPERRSVPEAPTAFPPGVASKLGTYVYLLVDPRSGRPFFVGSGRGDRCHRHVSAARERAPSDFKSSKYPLLERIREAEADGRTVRVEILRYGITPIEADLVETSVADALGLEHATGLDFQRGPAVEVGAGLARRAKFKRSHQVVVLRVGPHGTPSDYERARHGWRIARRWVDTASPRSPRWAVVVAGDLVVAVYRIDRWEPSPPAPGSSVDRFSFVGTPTPELDERYAGRSVTAYLGSGTPSAVTYVWCGPHWVNTAT
jgi:hypothetical protein